ncbi:MAG: NAD-binding protein, partial [Proteobacteria bacterium]|nr:NAD-binding protein [Pseudomonadota bacterium]
MKFAFSQIYYLLRQRDVRRNLRVLLSYLAVLVATITVYSVVFHLIMRAEGQGHSWLTGFYWTLTVMSTLGFGDITFHSDLGRGFSILVLLTGIVMLLIVLPFTFIRFFYAPWLEAQVRMRAPRRVSDDLRDHVILCRYDSVARDLGARLTREGIPYCVIEPDPVAAAELHADGVPVITGPWDLGATYEAMGVSRARLVLANLGDAENTNITLTIRELDADVPIACIAEHTDSVDVLELSGASQVLALKHDLAEQLAARIAVGTPQAHRIGHYKDVVIAEFPLYHTSLSGRTIRDTKLRELTGLNVVGVWERGKLLPAGPDTLLSKNSVPVIVGTEDQMTELDALFVIYTPNENPVVVIGGGKVGCATARALRKRGI